VAKKGQAKAQPKTTEAIALPVIGVYRQHDRKEQIDAILREHDQGIFRRSASLVDETFTDDRIYGVSSTRIGAVLSAPMRFDPANDSDEAKDIAEEIGGPNGRWHSMFPNPAASTILKWGIHLGVGVGKIVWEKPSPERWCARVVPWHPQNLRWDWMSRRFVMQTDRGQVVLPRPDEQPRGDGQWFVYCPYGVEYGWREGLVRVLGSKYLSRQWCERDSDRWCERQGLGIIKGIVPSTSQPEQRTEFFSQISNIGSEAAVLCVQDAQGKGYDLKVEEFAARTWEGMQNRKGTLDTDIAIVQLGQNLTTEVKEGSRAAAQTQNLVRIDYALKDAGVADAVRLQVLTWDAEYNHGDPNLACTPVYEVAPPDDDLGEAQSLKTLGEATNQLLLAEPRVDVATMLEERGVPLISEEEMAATQAVELEAGAGSGGSAALTPSAQGAIIKVNEARALIGLGPLLLDSGAPDPDGELTVAQFTQKYADVVGAAAEAEAGRPPEEPGAGTNAAEPPQPGEGEPTGTKAPVDLAVKVNMARALSAVALASGPVKQRYKFAGLDIAVENPAGSIRLWQDPEGKQGATRMVCDYGFIDGVLSGDGEELDVYIGPDPEAREVYVVHQLMAPAYRSHDEDKVMLGFISLEAARACFLAHRDDGERSIGGISVIPADRFRAKLRRRSAEATSKIHASRSVDRLVERLVNLAVGNRVGPRSVALKRSVGAEKRADKYHDRLVERSARVAARALAPDLLAVRHEIEKASSLSDARNRVVAALKSKGMAANHKRVTEIVTKINVLGRLAGLDSARKHA
jgi:hypothetical protein